MAYDPRPTPVAPPPPAQANDGASHDDGRKPVATFADRITDRPEDQGVLLEERERKVLEDELLTSLADQIHGRVIAARDLVRDMDTDTRSKPMSSGLAVGIRWVQSDKITDRQRAASRLPERAAPGQDRPTELRGSAQESVGRQCHHELRPSSVGSV